MSISTHLADIRQQALSIQTAARETKHDPQLGRYARAHLSEVEALAQTIVVQFTYIFLAMEENR